jgi:aminoglycoside phosphotransferase (APT) family kinase protein
MHDDQVEVGEQHVRALLEQQLPSLADLPINPVRSTGTVNALFRLGDDFVARLPLVARWRASIEREAKWLPWVRERVDSLRVPEPVFTGRPGSDYPFPWAVHRWIDGAPYDDALVADERTAAIALAGFVRALRSIDVVPGAPPAGRRPLRELDEQTRAALRASAGTIDVAAALAVWENVLESPAWDGERTWIHSDLLRPNLLVDEGQLVAVIDFGGFGTGDPASDLTPAWTVFGPEGREVFRAELDPDNGEWSRGRGVALHQASLIIPYYVETNPEFVALAKRTIEQIVEDFRGTEAGR